MFLFEWGLGDAGRMVMDTLSVVPGDSRWQQHHAKVVADPYIWSLFLHMMQSALQENARDFSEHPQQQKQQYATQLHQQHSAYADNDSDKLERLKRAQEQQQKWRRDYHYS